MQTGQQASPTAKKKVGLKKGIFRVLLQGGGESLLSPLQGMSSHVVRRAITEEK